MAPIRQGGSINLTLALLIHEAQVHTPGFPGRGIDAVKPSGQGRYIFYRLTKRGLGTIEAVEAICRRWNLASHRISYGGLKDRHAETIQYLTIQDGPARPLRETSFELEPIGRLPHPYGPQHSPGQPVPRRDA